MSPLFVLSIFSRHVSGPVYPVLNRSTGAPIICQTQKDYEGMPGFLLQRRNQSSADCYPPRPEIIAFMF